MRKNVGDKKTETKAAEDGETERWEEKWSERGKVRENENHSLGAEPS